MVTLSVDASCIKIVLLFLLFLSPRVNHLTLSICLIPVLKACTKPTEENAGEKKKEQQNSTQAHPPSLTVCIEKYFVSNLESQNNYAQFN